MKAKIYYNTSSGDETIEFLEKIREFEGNASFGTDIVVKIFSERETYKNDQIIPKGFI